MIMITEKYEEVYFINKYLLATFCENFKKLYLLFM